MKQRRYALIPRRVFDEVLSDVERETGVSRKDILSRRRIPKIAHARHYAMWLLRQARTPAGARYSTPEIGHAFGRDHATVLIAVRQHEARLAEMAAVSRTISSAHSNAWGGSGSGDAPAGLGRPAFQPPHTHQPEKTTTTKEIDQWL